MLIWYKKKILLLIAGRSTPQRHTGRDCRNKRLCSLCWLIAGSSFPVAAAAGRPGLAELYSAAVLTRDVPPTPKSVDQQEHQLFQKKKKKKERAPSTSKDFNIILFSFEDPLQGAGFQRKGKASRDDKPKGSVLYNKLGKYICMLDKIVINIEYV